MSELDDIKAQNKALQADLFRFGTLTMALRHVAIALLRPQLGRPDLQQFIANLREVAERDLKNTPIEGNLSYGKETDLASVAAADLHTALDGIITAALRERNRGMAVSSSHKAITTPSGAPLSELDDVFLKSDKELQDAKIVPRESRGTIVSVHDGGEAYTVEFTNPFHALLILDAREITAIPEATRERLGTV